MKRPIIGLFLGGILLLSVAACGSPATSDPVSDVAGIPKPENADSESIEVDSRPIVTVNLSPT